jgi:hypothetical protein
VEVLECRTVPTTFTMTSPTSLGLLPSDVTPVGGIVLDLVGRNGARIVSQLPASSLFEGSFDQGTPTAYRGNPGTIGIQTGFTPQVLTALGGGLAEVAVRLTVLDGDTGAGDFDRDENRLLLNGLAIGDFSGVVTEETNEDGTQALTPNPDGGFRDSKLDTGFFYSNEPLFLADFYASLGSDGGVTIQLQDEDPYDNSFDFTAGLDGGLVSIGKPPAPVNSPPQITSVTNDGPVTSGSPVRVTVVASDPDGAAQQLTYEFDFDNDGTYEVSNSTGIAAHTFAGEGSFPVHVRVRDAAGGEARGSTTVQVQAQVQNAVPTYSAPLRQTAAEGSPTPFTLGRFADPGADAAWQVAIDWGDGSPTQSFTVSQAGDLGTLTHNYTQDGTYTIQVTITDGDGAAGSGTFAVEVANVAPVVDASGNRVTEEGTPTAFALGRFADPGADAAWQVAIDWGDGSPTQALTAGQAGDLGTLTHTFIQDGIFTVRVTVADGGLSHVGQFLVKVQNVPPVLRTIALSSQTVRGGPLTVSTRFTDRGTADRWTIIVDWGDGATTTTRVAPGANSSGLSHLYLGDPGPYAVTVTIQDEGGARDQFTTIVRVAQPPLAEVPALPRLAEVPALLAGVSLTPEPVGVPAVLARAIPAQMPASMLLREVKLANRDLVNAFRGLSLSDQENVGAQSIVDVMPPDPVPVEVAIPTPGEPAPEAPAPVDAPVPPVPAVPVLPLAVNNPLPSPNASDTQPARAGAVQTAVLVLSALLLQRHWWGSRASACNVLRWRMARGRKAPPPQVGETASAAESPSES